MKEYVAMILTQVLRVLILIISKAAIADGMSTYSFIFYSNVIASLVLLPFTLFFHSRSINHSPLSFTIICGFFVIGILGTLAQIFRYTGVSFSSATLGTTILNLVPAFTFLLAALCRMEAINIGSLTTQAKLIGTLVSIAGAIIMTLYKGPSILSSPFQSQTLNNLQVELSNWVLGGILLAIDAIFASMYIIAQAFVLKIYPAVINLMFFYCLVCTVLSGLACLILEPDLSSFSLLPNNRLIYVLFSGIIGYVFLATVQTWCVQLRGPVFVAMFHPIGIVIANFIGIIFLGDGFYLGSLLGSITVVIGFYSVMWGKAKEEKAVIVSKLQDEEASLLQDVVEEQITSPSL